MTEIIETIKEKINNTELWNLDKFEESENSYIFVLEEGLVMPGPSVFKGFLDNLQQYLAENEIYHELTTSTEALYKVILTIEKKDAKNKLYISVPTTGRTQEAISESMTKMHKLAEAFFDRHLVVVDMNYELADGSLYENAKKDKSFKDVNFDILNQSLRARVMAGADYYILCDYHPKYKECEIDHRILDAAGIQTYCGDTAISINPTQIGKDILEEYRNSLDTVGKECPF